MPTNFPDYRVAQPDLAATTEQYVEFHARLAAAGSAADCLAIVADWDDVFLHPKGIENMINTINRILLGLWWDEGLLMRTKRFVSRK